MASDRGGPEIRPAVAAASLTFAVALLAVRSAGAVPPHPRLDRGKQASEPDLTAAWAAGLDAPAARAAHLPEHPLVLLVDFSDEPHAGNLTAAVFDSLFFGANGSVRDYFARSSHGRLQLDGQVVGWLRLPQTFAFYADSEHQGRGVRGSYPRNARRMVEDAVRAADGFIDFAAFDSDGADGIAASGDDDGIVDALIVVHAGPASELGDPRGILSHTWSTVGVVPTAEGIGAWKYSTVSENSPLGVRVHEFGHLLGLADLYQRGSVTRLGGGLGDWSLMASGAWLGDGDTPADLDAASKLELGFVDPIVVTANRSGLPLRATQAGIPGDVYKVWTHGRPDFEYFVIENRQPRLLDSELPGGGMLVYHVDLHQAHNDTADLPRVQLLQADGREDIERRINNGDGGDPYPGGQLRIGPDSDPGTRRRDGGDSQLVIAAISAPTGSMTFDLQVETTPLFELARVHAVETDFGGDGTPESGEALQLDVQLANAGRDAAAITMTATAVPSTDAAWSIDTAMLAGLAKNDTAQVRFQLVPRADLGDPSGLTLRFVVASATGTDTLSTIVGLGHERGFWACLQPEPSRYTAGCSDPSAPWTVTPVDPGAAGVWSRETRPGEFGAVYRSAAGPRYANRADVALVSPTFLVPAGATLRLLHAYDTEDDAAGWARDGGRVEISIDGGTWTTLAPRGGYPRKLQPESVPNLAAAGVFAGSSPRRWDEFDLGGAGTSARLRFRFASGDSIAAAGWEIARVEVATSATTPGGAPRVELLSEPNPMRFPGRVSFRITASLTAAAQTATLAVYDPRGRLVRVLQHAPVPAESGYFIWDGTDAAGRRVASGLYFARLEWGGERATTKVLVLQ